MVIGRIRQLPPLVVAKIAAGEVIERPASVVKELLENSVDAGATRLDIDIEQGGVECIRVVDNGCGIEAEDLRLAFTSHATSKLADAEDLFRVQSLGFRGEALASIGGVARVTLQSRPTDAASGAEIHCDGGALSEVRPWNGAPGTRMEVRHLFYNTPVRRKFQRTIPTEMSHVTEAVTRLALAKPQLHIKLTHNERSVFEVAASAGLPERIRLFFGNEVADRLLPIDNRQGPARIHGFIADPAYTRGNNRMQYLFVNGRWIRDRSLGHALQEAYHGLLMTGRYCVAFLFLELPPDLVDVNVHPTKAEVRFRDSQALHQLVSSTVREKLRASDLTASMNSPPRPLALGIPVGAPSQPLPSGGATEEQTPEELFAEASVFPDEATSLRQPLQQTVPAGPIASQPVPGRAANEITLKALQLHDSYIVLETPEGMLVIDQHALHERILYEEWKDRVGRGEVEVQRLVVPEPVDLPPEQAAAALEQKAVLRRLGLGVEDFGGGTVLLSGYPAMLWKVAPGQLLRAAVEFLTTTNRAPTTAQLMDDLLKMMSCKAAIKAGDRLTSDEIAALVAQRHLADDTHHCPHGRPTALLFSKHELDRQFKRV
jgi:DNA mismatch repair protein MutL